MTYLGSTQQALNSNRHSILIAPDLTAIPESNIRTVEISFYDHEVYAGDKLIARIRHDDEDFVTQRWVVIINGIEIHRANTWARCYNYITWHYKQTTLPKQQQGVETATTGNEVILEISESCKKFGFDLYDDGIYYNDVKLSEVGCTNGKWWVTRASSQQHRKIPCDSAFDAVWLLWIPEASPNRILILILNALVLFVDAQSEIFHREGLLDKPCDELTTIEWEQLKKYKPLP
jgi:hypothetical protein